ncbi:MAG: glycerophosphodiester phosphodiesterase [Mesorhizobium amorphae]|nr:MAG: glycerophosphodiester phosphodiesterase [Mesorhizobium amorphae]
MTAKLLAATAIVAIAATSAWSQEQQFPAKLVEQAVLPANTLIPAPADAPEHLRQSGKFSTADRKRADTLGSVPGKDGVRPTGLSLPFDGQPVQGFSGIKAVEGDTFWTLSDNGFGNKLNSTDAALMLHRLSFDWANGTVNRNETVFLSDPDKRAPFPIVLEGSDTRYLTGGDFDVESIQPAADGFWVGEEFGPYLLHFTADGKLTDVFETVVDGEPVRSPDHPALALPANPTAKLPVFNLKRSGGYEGLAMSKDGSKLYGMLEGPRFLADGEVEKADGRTAVRVIEFDVASKAWTGRSWLYPFSEGGEAIGDFNMIDDTTALVIERDNGAGLASAACADPAKPAADCFDKPSKLKRIYKIEMTDANVGGAVRKIGYVDLLDIRDTDGKARQGAVDGTYTMPFVTIENVDVLDEARIIVGNDNNLPFSAGRALDKADDTEFVVLEVPELLAAK